MIDVRLLSVRDGGIAKLLRQHILGGQDEHRPLIADKGFLIGECFVELIAVMTIRGRIFIIGAGKLLGCVRYQVMNHAVIAALLLTQASGVRS